MLGETNGHIHRSDATLWEAASRIRRQRAQLSVKIDLGVCLGRISRLKLQILGQYEPFVENS